MKFLQTILCFLFLAILIRNINAQNLGPGMWRAHFPFHHIKDITDNGKEVIAATDGGVLFYNPADKSMRTLTTVSGLSGTEVSAVAFDSLNNQLIIAYNNFNIDIYNNSNIDNFPAIKNSGITGEKRINHIYFKDDLSYVSGTFGILQIDFQNLVVNETYRLSDGSFNVEVFNIAENGNIIMAATNRGIYEANINNTNLFDVRQWTHHDSLQLITRKPVNQIAYHQNNFYCLQNDTIYVYKNNEWQHFYQPNDSSAVRFFAFDEENLYASELRTDGSSKMIAFSDDEINHTYTNYSFQRPDKIHFFNNSIWLGDNWQGLHEINDSAIQLHRPSAPTDESVYAISVDSQSNVWVAAGSAPSNFGSGIIYSNRGVYKFDNYNWDVTNTYTLNAPQFLDIISVAVHPQTGLAYLGTYIYGLYTINGDKELRRYDELNSGLERSVGNEVSIIDMAFDRSNNLWLSNNKTNHPIKLLTNDGEWHAFKPDFSLPSQTFTEILVTELYNQVWITVDKRGILVYDYGDDITATFDDRYIFIESNPGSGNLPNEQVYAMAEDKDGEIWIGTIEGIGIFLCPYNLFEPEGCDAYIPLVEIEVEIGAPLLESDVINCITIDEANRKWIGTNNGVWLLSEDGDEVVHQFTIDNSPIPSNEIKDIAINPKSGEVFIGTAKGIISYQSSASEGSIDYDEVQIFPNPVRPNYKGDITIKNLVDQSNVKITDVSGNLVYETTSLGGQVVWNGADYTGREVGSGVYMVFATNNDGSEGYEGKIMIVR